MMHAEVRINEDRIARVSVHRVRSSRSFQAPHIYRWRVTEGEESTGGDILHLEPKGWVALLAAVLTAYDARRPVNAR